MSIADELPSRLEDGRIRERKGKEEGFESECSSVRRVFLETLSLFEAFGVYMRAHACIVCIAMSYVV